jgi:hypothetical protein
VLHTYLLGGFDNVTIVCLPSGNQKRLHGDPMKRIGAITRTTFHDATALGSREDELRDLIAAVRA